MQPFAVNTMSPTFLRAFQQTIHQFMVSRSNKIQSSNLYQLIVLTKLTGLLLLFPTSGTLLKSTPLFPAFLKFL